MGNTSSNAGGSNNLIFSVKEHVSGKCLIAAIQLASTTTNERTNGVLKAIETARGELIKKSALNNSTDENYKIMLSKMLLYLTRKYNVGKGFTKETPLEFANSLNLVDTVQLIQQHIDDLERSLSSLSESGAKGVPGGIEKVESERVQLAKERLKAYREGRSDSS